MNPKLNLSIGIISMKHIFLFLVLPCVLWGCGPKKSAGDAAQATTAATSAAVAQPTITMVESPETKGQNEIKLEALTLFTNKDYRGLEALAALRRGSKARYPNGNWKLTFTYAGLEPSNEESAATWQARLALADDWIRARPESMTARVAKARLLIAQAWKIRSSDWADNVAEANWKPFQAKLVEATAVLNKAKPLQERCPIYWAAWQKVAVGLGMRRTDYDALVSQAIKEFPDYGYYYNSRAIFLLPRWYGKEGEWERDLTKSADELGGEAGDKLYAQVVCEVHNHGGVVDVFQGKQASWERVDKGFEGLLKEFPDSLATKNERAFLAGLAGDKAKAQAYLAQLNGEGDLTVWHSQDKLDRFLKWAYAP